MHEFSQPAIVEPATAGSLVDHLTDHLPEHGRNIAVRVKRFGRWIDVTASQLHDEIRMVAKGIAAAGVQPGDRVGIMSATRYEWTLADYAIWYVGAVPVPIYETSSAEQVEWILSDSGAVAVFLETEQHRAVFDEVAAALPNIGHVWVFERDAMDELAEAGELVGDDDLDARRATLNPLSVATIVYTSGTTGQPKGCTLTHQNLMYEIDTVAQAIPELFKPGESTLLFLPLAHVFGRAIQLGCIRSGVTLGHCADVADLLGSLADFQPTFLLSVPRVFEKVYNGARQKAHAAGRGRIFDLAANCAISYSEALDRGGPDPLLRAQHALFDRLVYGKLRAALGGRVTHAVSGGAALGTRLGHFFRGIGVTVLEGYGLTETSAASNLNRPDALRIGSVGRPLPGITVRIGNDGEILLHGRTVFAGYWNNEVATKEVLDPDGWFATGDIGELDSDGYLTITGRKKELIVTSGGKNVAPAVLEDRVRSSFLVSQCMVIGDNRPYITALITIDPESYPAWLATSGLPEGTTIEQALELPALRQNVEAAVDAANRAVSKAESIRRFTILPEDWTQDGGELTPSMKLRRNVVMDRFAAQVEELYR